MDCQTFDTSLLEALYDELDASSARELAQHAARCERCAARLAAAKKTRELVRPALEAPLPDELEARILAAAGVERAPHARATEARGPAPEPPPKAGEVVSIAERTHGPDRKKGGGFVAFLSRPHFAVAATFLLVLGAAAVVTNTASTHKAPLSTAPSAAAPLPAAQEAAREVPLATATAAPAIAHAPPPAAASAAAAAPRAAALADDEARRELDTPSRKPGARAESSIADGKARSRTTNEARPAREYDAAFDPSRVLVDAGQHATPAPPESRARP
jgi:hypothetical protein